MVRLAELVHGIYENGQICGIDEGLDAMAEVENVARSVSVSCQGLPDFVTNA